MAALDGAAFGAPPSVPGLILAAASCQTFLKIIPASTPPSTLVPRVIGLYKSLFTGPASPDS